MGGAHGKVRPRKAAAVQLDGFTPDAFAIRTTKTDGTSHGGFQWPLTVDAIVTAPDWNPRPVCGGGLHGLLDAIGGWNLLANANTDAIFWIVAVRRDECVAIGTDKVKFPRCRVVAFGSYREMAKRILDVQVPRVLALAKGNTATGDSGHAAATGHSGHAAATGHFGHAAATGDSGHAAATGDSAIAVALGLRSTAKAGPDGWIVLTAHDAHHNLVLVKVGKVGVDVEAHKTYRLTASGKFEEVK
jgi:hypothetical protein